jgi:cytochrome b6-f complex iron-sulfur subunit
MSQTTSVPTSSAAPASPLVTRRNFIQIALAALGATWLGLLVQSWLFPPQISTQEAKPVEFPLSELPVGGVKTVAYGGSPVIVLRTPESVRAYSMVCTHLGCLVLWQEGQKEFYCPCHDGRFDQFGEVIAGPPPVPLEQIPVSVQGEQVIVGETV